jgi:ribosomal protein L13
MYIANIGEMRNICRMLVETPERKRSLEELNVYKGPADPLNKK